MRRAVIASTVGTTIEWYDFLLYGVVTGLAFGKLFFPRSDPLVGVLEAFSIYAVGFIARPIGAAIFGHFGDRVGRKAVLIATLLITGFATFAVGLVPTYESIGIWGAVIFTAIRFIQGIGSRRRMGRLGAAGDGVGAHQSHRGFVAAWARNSASRPDCCWLTSAVLVFSWFAGDQFLVWGWRIPFLLSIVMAGVGLYIRLGILETPIFQRLVEEKRVERAPVLEVIRRQPKEIILCALGENCGNRAGLHLYRLRFCLWHAGAPYVARVFARGADRRVRAGVLRHPVSGHLSDRIGRKRMYLIGAIATGDVRLRLFRDA